MDTEIKNLHRMDDTMLQWCIEAVPVSNDFPNGVKTRYRAYASSQVVKIVKMPKLQCKTPEGALTGLEAYTVLVRWEPAMGVDGRTVEGTYLLKTMPGLANRDEYVPPSSFAEGGLEKINATFGAVCKTWDVNTKERKMWQDWMSKLAPRSNNAIDYIDGSNVHHNYFFPLKAFFVKDNYYRLKTVVAIPKVVVEQYTFPWPTNLVTTNASVRTDRNMNPPPPYTYHSAPNEGVYSVAAFTVDAASYYQLVLKEFKQKELQLILQRKVHATGESIGYTGTKSEQLKRIEDWDATVIRKLYQGLNQRSADFTASILQHDPEALQIVCKVGGEDVLRSHLYEFNVDCKISLFTLNLMIILFQERDDRMQKAYTDVNGNKRPPKIRKRSHYCNPNFTTAFFEDGSMNIDTPSFLGQSLRTLFFDLYRVYIPIYNENGLQLELVIIEVEKKRILILDLLQVNSVIRRDHIYNRLLTMIESIPVDTRPNDSLIGWSCNNYPQYPNNVKLFDAITNENLYDAGIYMSIIIELVYHDLPLIFHKEHTSHFRKLFCHSIANECLSL